MQAESGGVASEPCSPTTTPSNSPGVTVTPIVICSPMPPAPPPLEQHPHPDPAPAPWAITVHRERTTHTVDKVPPDAQVPGACYRHPGGRYGRRCRRLT